MNYFINLFVIITIIIINKRNSLSLSLPLYLIAYKSYCKVLLQHL